MASSLRSSITAISGALLLEACHGDCTLLGCSSGLTIHLPSLPTGAYSVEVVVSDGNGPRYIYECNSAPNCLQDVFFLGLRIDHPIIRVITTKGSRTTEIPNLKYRAVYPNGEDCGGACYVATVTAQLP